MRKSKAAGGRERIWASLAFVMFLACMCAAQVQPQAKTVGADPVFPDAAQIANSKAAPSPPVGGDSSVRLGVGDLVEVSVYDVPELTTRTRVSTGGDVYLPLIEYVHVDGLTVEDAERVIEKRLDQGGFVRNPHVQLFVSEYASEGASILGEVSKPGVYPVIGEQRLFNLISVAGGLTDRVGKNISITHRAQPDKPVVVPLSHNLQDHPESNVPVYAGDTIMVRRADIIYVVGEVGRPSGFLMDKDGRLSVLQAIALAGGPTPNAKLSQARIIRRGAAGISEVPVPLKKLLQAKAGDISLEPEDILFVPSSSRRAVSGRTAEMAAQLATGVALFTIRP
jgi:polysaccharide export outer membrane protein